MSEKSVTIITPEKMKPVERMLIFDVDGVITNPQEKRVTEPEILDEILKKLEKGEPVALNTGRSIEWVKDRVLNPLMARVKDKLVLQNLLAVGEKGGTWAEFDNEGNLSEHKNDNISVPEDLKNQIRELIKSKYPDSMFYDESKLTMISTEMIDGHSIDDYREKQKSIGLEFAKILEESKIADKFKIDPTTIATDIENKFVGKHFAIKRIIDWVREKGFNPAQYLTFGDSFRSDIPMAEQLFADKLPVEFVYVGKEVIDISKYPFVIKQTQEKYGKGTVEFLKAIT